jgi:hypothetical protein
MLRSPQYLKSSRPRYQRPVPDPNPDCTEPIKYQKGSTARGVLNG